MMTYVYLLLSIVLIVAGIYAWRAVRKYMFLDNFGVVEKGMIYRSGQLYPFQTERVIAKYGIKTILHGHVPELSAKDTTRLRAVCEEYKVKTLPIMMPGDGRGGFEQYDAAVEILRDSNNLPVLVCCARGTHRTGAMVAAYRVLVQGWPVSEALGEMEKFRFRPLPHRYKGGEHPLVPHLKEYFRLHAERKS